MADEAGIYDVLWHPDESGITYAKQLIEPLRSGLEKLEGNPEHYRQFDSPNGWGTYGPFVKWVREYLAACEEYPDAKVVVSR